MAGTGARFKIESILDSAGHLCGTAPPSPLSVRYFSARSGSVPSYDDGEGLNLEWPLAQSAFSPLLSAAWLKIAVSIAPAAAMRSSLTLWVYHCKANLTSVWRSKNER